MVLSAAELRNSAGWLLIFFYGSHNKHWLSSKGLWCLLVCRNEMYNVDEGNTLKG